MARRTPTPDTPDHDDAAGLRDRVQALVADMDPADAGRVLASLLEVGGRRMVQPVRGPRARLRRPRRPEVMTYRVRIDLEDARPPIWRRLDLRSDVTLDAVHQVIQASFGWLDYHLHRFALGGNVWDDHAELFLCPFDVEEGEDEGTPTQEVRLDETLAEPGDRLRYCYDYGDSWELTIKLEEVRGRLPEEPPAVCIDGRRAAPPEDCGGLRDAADLATVLEDPAAFDLEEVNVALQDPFLALRDYGLRGELVDLLNRLRGWAGADDLVARAAAVTLGSASAVSHEERAAALHPVLWFLDRVGSQGLTLTAAGYLKPVEVAAAADVLPRCADSGFSTRSEADCHPVRQFRESLQAVGLLRKARGRLTLTKAGVAALGNPDTLWRHLTRRVPTGSERSFEHQAGLPVLLLVASGIGERVPYTLVAEAMTELGWTAGGDGPITEYAVRHAVRDVTSLLGNLVTGPAPSSWLELPPSPVAVALAREALAWRE